MQNTLKQSARKILEAAPYLTPAQQIALYRDSFPDITPQEALELYPLFLQATAAGQTAEEWRESWTRYQTALAPIRERQPKRRPQERDRWKTY